MCEKNSMCIVRGTQIYSTEEYHFSFVSISLCCRCVALLLRFFYTLQNLLPLGPHTSHILFPLFLETRSHLQYTRGFESMRSHSLVVNTKKYLPPWLWIDGVLYHVVLMYYMPSRSWHLQIVSVSSSVRSTGFLVTAMVRIFFCRKNGDWLFKYLF